MPQKIISIIQIGKKSRKKNEPGALNAIWAKSRITTEMRHYGTKNSAKNELHAKKKKKKKGILKNNEESDVESWKTWIE